MRTRTARRGIRTAAALVALALAATACSDEVGAPTPGRGNPFFTTGESAAPVLLQAERSCDAVLEDFQAFAPAVLSAPVLGFGAGDIAVSRGPMPDMAVEDSATASAPAASREAAFETVGGDVAGGTSSTNTQEAGIDEPDLVETDGEHVFVVDQEDLVVLDGASGEVVSRTRLASYGAQLLLHGDRLLVVAGGMSYDAPISIEGDAGIGVEPDIQPVPIDPPPFPAGTIIQLLDVSDRAAPRLVQTTELEGSHVTTRVIDGVARVVIASWPDQPVLEGMSFRGDPTTSSGQAAAREALVDSIAETEIADWLPSFRTTVAETPGPATDEGPLVACEDVMMPEVNAGLGQTSILRVDLEEGFDPADTTTVVAEAGTVYASAERLYVAANRYVPVEEQGQVVSEDVTTALHAFDLTGDGPAAHLATGEIPGHVLNQYSLSEHDGHLRVATTEGASWAMEGAEPSQSGVRVLRLDGDRLVEVGSVTGLGLTETIQSVRFMGDVGYVVTFRQTDPLYVIDLSEPTAPRAVGELKIPGFSSYLHPIGDGRLVGVGRDADIEGQDRGLLVSLFDVTDPTQPRQLQTWTAADAWSQAGGDPKAFLHWAPESAVVVPLERYAAFDDAGREIAPARTGMAVLDVDDRGISERALVQAEGRSPSRALVVQDRLWSLFDGGLVVSDFDGVPVGSFRSYR